MNTLQIINAANFAVFNQQDRVNEKTNATTATLFSIDDKHPVPLISIHFNETDYEAVAGSIETLTFDNPRNAATYFGEMKITKKQNPTKDEYFVDFIENGNVMDNSPTEGKDNDIYAIIAIPTCGFLKNIKVDTSNEDTDIELLKVRVARYGKQELPVYINKNKTPTKGTWGFDKILYCMVKMKSHASIDVHDRIDVSITTTIEHCGKFGDNGTADLTTRKYDYNITINFGDTYAESNIIVSYLDKKVTTERPVAFKYPDALSEVNPYIKKPDKVKSSSNEKFINKPRWKNEKKPGDKKLDIPAPPPFDYNDKQKNRRRKGNKKKNRNRYDD